MAMNTLDALGATDADRWAYNRLMNRQQAGPAPSYGRTTPPGMPGQPAVPPQGQAPQTSPVAPPAVSPGMAAQGAAPSYISGEREPRNEPDRPSTAPPDRGPGPWQDGYVPNPVPPGGYPPGIPPPEAPKRPSYSYQGGPLDFFGTGDIDNVDHIKRGNVGDTGGFTEDGLNGNTGVRGSNSIKNVNGRFFSNLPAKPSSIPILLANPEFRAIFPNAKQVGFDKIDYGDGKPVDVLEQADPNTDTAKRWQWGVESTVVPTTAGKGYSDWKAQQPPPDTPPDTPPPDPTAPPDTGIRDDAYRELARERRISSRKSLADLV